MKITIIGAGYVGIAVAVGFASLSNEVYVYDIDFKKIEMLKSFNLNMYEKELSDNLRIFSKNIIFLNNLDSAIKNSDVIFITVNTEYKRNKINLKNFNNAINILLKHISSPKVIVIKSTVPIGTTEKIREVIKKKFKDDIKISVNPEFLREGSALRDFLNPDRIVIGVEDNFSKEVLLELYEPINSPKLVVDFKTAEMIKYASNTFLATKISFINEIANICEDFGINVNDVAKGIGLDRRIGESFLGAGIGFGGSCLPKDLMTLIHLSEEKNYKPVLLEAVYYVNQKQIDLFVKKIEKVLKGYDKKIAVWGVSFKGETDDVRDSPAIEIIKRLLKKKYEISVYDPRALDKVREKLDNTVLYARDYLDAVKEKNAILILSDWKEFLTYDLTEVYKQMNKHFFFDGRNLFDSAFVSSKGFNYFGVGIKNNF